MSAEHAFCPNCGARWLWVPDDFWDTEGGCGQCAQAGVRPRSLYRLMPLSEEYRQHADLNCREIKRW